MKRKKDPFEQMIHDALLEEAKYIDEEMAGVNIEPMSPEHKEDLKQKILAQIEGNVYGPVYDQLSEEDRRALELGKEMLKKEKVVYRKKKKKMCYVLAAVLILVLAVGVTSMGGAERISEIMHVMIGDREMVRVDSEDNYIIKSEVEDEAYEQLREVFGVEAVRILLRPEGMDFVFSEIDEELQTATLGYTYNKEAVYYYISSHYTDNSWGIDVEDQILDQYIIEHEEKVLFEVKEYEVEGHPIKRYSANFRYEGLEYYLIGTMKRADFEFLLKNLKFF